MTIHQFNEKMLPDEDFVPGRIEFLVEGNSCRLLDARRTPGLIEEYFEDSAMFRWRITDFEDKGKSWDLPAENIIRFQFPKEAQRLTAERVREIEAAVEKFQRRLIIEASEANREKTESEIEVTERTARQWLEKESLFLKNQEQLSLDSREGPSSLADDMIRYMASAGLEELEGKTAENIVLNPHSGEWMKGMQIVLAETGLADYKGKIPRTEDIFEGPGAKERRRDYLIHRLAFVRAYFHLLGVPEVVLYRGMSTEQDRKGMPRTFLSCTFSLEVAKSFTHFERDSKFRSSYLVKSTYSVDRLFMTYLETRAMNRQYKEAEALVLCDRENRKEKSK